MVVAIFVRRLKEGLTFADFKSAWEAERGFGVTADPREIAAGSAESILSDL